VSNNIDCSTPVAVGSTSSLRPVVDPSPGIPGNRTEHMGCWDRMPVVVVVVAAVVVAVAVADCWDQMRVAVVAVVDVGYSDRSLAAVVHTFEGKGNLEFEGPLENKVVAVAAAVVVVVAVIVVAAEVGCQVAEEVGCQVVEVVGYQAFLVTVKVKTPDQA